jgi:hypothetical protein
MSQRRVVVCGGGAGGMAAALGAAHAGAAVSLLEARSRPGGTVAHALIHTLGGLFDDAGQLINDGLASELVRRLTEAGAAHDKRRLGRAWVLDVCPDAYQTVTERWLAAQSGICMRTTARVGRIWVSAGRIDAVEALGPAGAERIEIDAVIDATGTAEVVRQLDPTLLIDDGPRAAGGFIFRLRGIEPAAREFPRNLQVVRALQRAAEDGTLPASCGRAWLDRGIHDDEVFVKLFVPLPDDWRQREERGEISSASRAIQTAIVAFLGGLPGFGGARITATGELGIREGGRVHGEYCLSVDDVRQGRRFTDAACRAAWPIEYWDPEQGVKLEYLPAGSYYEVPLRSLRVRKYENLWVAGKCLCADRLAQASARVVGTCWAMGEAAGAAAAGS